MKTKNEILECMKFYPKMENEKVEVWDDIPYPLIRIVREYFTNYYIRAIAGDNEFSINPLKKIENGQEILYTEMMIYYKE